MRRPLLLVNDHKRVEEVYRLSEQYLEAHADLQQEIAAHLLAYHEVRDLIPFTVDKLGSGHLLPYAESYYELESSFELCKQGFYRHSLFALRCVLELAAAGLYFDKNNNDEAYADLRKWARSDAKTPRFTKTLLKKLFELEYFRQFDGRFGLHETVRKLYRDLYKYTHVQGYRFSSLGQVRANVNRFDEERLRRYVDYMKQVVESAITMMLLKYPIGMQTLPLWEKFGFNPPAGGLLDEDSRSAVLEVLDEESRQALQDISDRDADVTVMASHIRAGPDLTGEQLEAQRRAEG